MFWSFESHSLQSETQVEGSLRSVQRVRAKIVKLSSSEAEVDGDGEREVDVGLGL